MIKKNLHHFRKYRKKLHHSDTFTNTA